MIYLNKLLPIFLLPTGFSLICLVIGLLWRKWLCWVSLLVLWIAATPAVATWAMRSAEGWQIRQSIHEMPSAQAIVVLSGMLVNPPGNDSIHEFGDGIDRFEGGLSLLEANKAPLLIFTAGWVPWNPDATPEGEVLASLAAARGIAREQIYVTERVSNTAEEAQAVAEYLRNAQSGESSTIILVTSAFHMRRATLLFEQQGLTVIPYPVDFRASEGRIVTLLDLAPTADSLAQTEQALRELYGYLFYRIFY